MNETKRNEHNFGHHTERKKDMHQASSTRKKVREREDIIRKTNVCAYGKWIQCYVIYMCVCEKNLFVCLYLGMEEKKAKQTNRFFSKFQHACMHVCCWCILTQCAQSFFFPVTNWIMNQQIVLVYIVGWSIINDHHHEWCIVAFWSI